MTESAKPVFIFISSKQCGTCKSYMPLWPAHKQQISKVANVIEITLNKTNDALPNNYPPGLTRYKSWLPMFLLVPASEWKMNSNSVAAAAFNATDDGKSLTFTGAQDYPLVPTWVMTQLAANPLFKQNTVQTVTSSPVIKVPEVCGLVLNRYN